MRWLLELIFPPLCNRCKERSENFICNLCTLGIELSKVNPKEITAHLFDSKISFLYVNRASYRNLIIAFTLVQLNKLNWKYAKVESEPELIYLKKYLEKSQKLCGHKTLYLLHRDTNPILRKSMRKDSFVLII